jgi:hypothetical protein
MNTDPSLRDAPQRGGSRYPFLERTTGVVLLLVLVALGWMTLVAFRPEWGQGIALPVQVWLLLALLTAALVLVSIVALLHVRSSGD